MDVSAYKVVATIAPSRTWNGPPHSSASPDEAVRKTTASASALTGACSTSTFSRGTPVMPLGPSWAGTWRASRGWSKSSPLGAASSRGYDEPPTVTGGKGIATFEDGGKAAYFKDPDGHVLSLATGWG